MFRFSYRIMCGNSPEDSFPVAGEEIFFSQRAAYFRASHLRAVSVDGPCPQNFWVETIDPRD